MKLWKTGGAAALPVVLSAASAGAQCEESG